MIDIEFCLAAVTYYHSPSLISSSSHYSPPPEGAFEVAIPESSQSQTSFWASQAAEAKSTYFLSSEAPWPSDILNFPRNVLGANPPAAHFSSTVDWTRYQGALEPTPS